MEINDKVKKVQEEYISSLRITKRKGKKPILVALVGLVGAGKSSVAKVLAPLIGATILEGDYIRVLLRKAGEPYRENVFVIALNAGKHILNKGGNIIIDADHVPAHEKTQRLIKEAQKAHAKLVFVRTVCNIDTIIGRIVEQGLKNNLGEFFDGAQTGLTPDLSKYHGIVVKIREMWRRTPHHYDWTPESGGQWKLKAFKMEMLTTIDTTSEDWRSQVKDLAKKLMK